MPLLSYPPRLAWRAALPRCRRWGAVALLLLTLLGVLAISRIFVDEINPSTHKMPIIVNSNHFEHDAPDLGARRADGAAVDHKARQPQRSDELDDQIQTAHRQRPQDDGRRLGSPVVHIAEDDGLSAPQQTYKPHMSHAKIDAHVQRWRETKDKRRSTKGIPMHKPSHPRPVAPIFSASAPRPFDALQLKHEARIQARNLQQEEIKTWNMVQELVKHSHNGALVNAVELSVQRSGSTAVMSIFSLISNAFVLPEPHNMFDVNMELPEFMDKNAELPSVQSLLDCSFIGSTAVRNVFWKYACNNIGWIRANARYWMQCLQGTLSTEV